MMAAVSLLTGACTLREEDQFLDYTIEVEDEQFRVHKLVMASVSDYFKVMLTGGMVESETDRVRLEGQSSLVVADMIKFIYTGQFDSTEVSAEELLACSLYLQIPAAIKECSRLLLGQIDDRNWFRILTTFKNYACEDGVDQTVEYIRIHSEDIVRVCVPHEISYDELLCLIDNWQMSEWKLFNSVQQWVAVDYENRQKHLKDLMSQVRFGLMTPRQVEEVKETDVYTKSEGSWLDLVVKAEEYHSLPTHVKVLDESEQSRVRGGLAPICYNYNVDSSTLYSLSNGKSWKQHEVPGTPRFEYEVDACLAVNNYLIVCAAFFQDTHLREFLRWHIFDPRTLTWSSMAHHEVNRQEFAVVHHVRQLYALGGRTDAIEKYDFESDTWSVITSKLPVAMHSFGAGVIDGCIYVAGGYRCDAAVGENEASTSLDCLDLSTDTWTSRAALPETCTDTDVVLMALMKVMKLWGEEVLFFIDQNFAMHYYSPKADQWSRWDCLSDVVSDIVRCDRPDILVDQNTIFVGAFCYDVKVKSTDDNYSADVKSQDYVGCAKWTVGKKGEKISEVRLADFPVDGRTYSDEASQNLSVLLSIPQHL